MRQALARTAYADITLDQIVVRFELPVADGPVFSVAIAAGGFKLVVAEAITLARPAKRLAPDLAAANPHERFVGGKGIGMLQVIDEELVAVLVAGVAQALHRLRAQKLALISKAAEF